MEDINNNKHELTSAEKYDLEKRITHIKLWTAIVVLLGALVPTATAWIKLDKVLALLEDKPFEGVWQYESNYEKYYDEDDPHMLYGTGRATMIWKQEAQQYAVNISYGIERSASAQPLLASAFHGFLEVGAEGWPLQNFTMDGFRIVNRLHYKNMPPSLPTYQFKNCSYDKKGNRATTIRCDFVTPQTKSKMRLTWISPLH